MTSTKQNKNGTKKRDSRQVLAAKNTQALGAARVQKKKTAASNAKSKRTNGENIHATRPATRARSRLGNNANVNAPPPPDLADGPLASKKVTRWLARPRANLRTPSPAPTYEDNPTDTSHTSAIIQDLQRQLREEKSK
jgi:hypothetical protein